MRYTVGRMVSSILLFALMSCTGTPLSTPSGRPETVVSSADIGHIKRTVIDVFARNGFALVGESANSIQFRIEITTGASALFKTLLGNSYPSDPEWEVTVALVAGTDNTKLLANAFTTGQNARGRLDRQDMATGKAGKDLQAYLESVKADIESGEGRIGVVFRGIEVLQLTPGGTAGPAGVRVGDRILEVDGHALDGNLAHDIRLLTGPPGSTAVLRIERGPQIISIEVARRKPK